MDARRQTTEELEARLKKGSELLWADEQAGQMGTQRYAERLALFRSLLAIYVEKCQVVPV